MLRITTNATVALCTFEFRILAFTFQNLIRVNFSKDLLIKQELIKTYWASIMTFISRIDWVRALS